MSRLEIIAASMLLVIAPLTAVAQATVELNAVTFPERRDIDLAFRATDRAPQADITAEVEFEDGQAVVDIDFKGMKPAVLFGGDITCYVVWAVSRDSSYENLGELWMPEANGSVALSSGRKSFALLITAEAYALVDRPSELVIFTSLPTDDKRAANAPFRFAGLVPPADHDVETITRIAWDSSAPLDVVQAEKALDLAQRMGAENYAPYMMRDAKIAFGQARNLATTSKTKTRIDYSRRSFALASEAIQTTLRNQEAEELARQIAERRAEMTALDERAAAAEERSAKADAALQEARSAIAEADAQRLLAEQSVAAAEAELARIAGEKRALEEEQAALNASMIVLRQEGDELRAEAERLRQESEELRAEAERLRQEREELRAEAERLRQEGEELRAEAERLRLEGEELRAEAERLRLEREQLAGRLQGALSQVADTHDSARGFIVNLPDILFDVNQATLKQSAQLVIAKLTGILLIMPELNLRIEGHTDSQGSDAYNQRLSEQRADSVKNFLESNGIANGRMISEGYGEYRPVADNTTAEGRQKNRRVEIVIARGEIAEAEE